VEVNRSGKHSSLSQYGRKKFYCTDPGFKAVTVAFAVKFWLKAS